MVLSCVPLLFTSTSQVRPSEGQLPPWRVDARSAIPISVPADIRRKHAPDLDYDEGEPIKGVTADLNGDGRRDYLLESAPSLCGNGGCVYVVCDGATHNTLGQFFGSPLYVLAERSHGYPTIATYSHQSAESGTYTEYRFDGHAYVVESSRTLEGAALDRLLATLRSLPPWRGAPTMPGSTSLPRH